MAAVTVDEVRDWGSLDTGQVAAPGIIQLCIDAAVGFISAHYALLDDDPAAWAGDAHLAVIMQAARLYKRRRSPEGVAGFGELGVVRVSRLDPDVHDLLSIYQVLRITGAGGPCNPWALAPVPEPALQTPVETGLFSAMWQYSTSDTMADPGARHFRDNADTTQLALSITDDDSVDRHAALVALAAGDRVALRSTQTADAWGVFVLTGAPVDLDTWVRLDVALTSTGSAAQPPNGNDRVLFDFVRPAEPEPDPEATIYLRTADFPERHIYI